MVKLGRPFREQAPLANKTKKSLLRNLPLSSQTQSHKNPTTQNHPQIFLQTHFRKTKIEPKLYAKSVIEVYVMALCGQLQKGKILIHTISQKTKVELYL